MKKSESIQNLAVALVKFNGEITKIEKDSKNPHFRNTYASLDAIIDEIRPILHKHGLATIQMPGGDGENFSMTTMLIHESGEWIESENFMMRPVKNDPQGVGSCCTYARRYSLSAVLSLNTGEDDDGEKASRMTEGNGKTGKTPAPTSQPSEKLPESSSKASIIKAKYETLYGNLSGFDDWYAAQKQKYEDKQIEYWLTNQLQKLSVAT